MMDLKGPFPKKMLKKGEFSMQHFEDDPAMSFCLMEIDPLTNRPVHSPSSCCLFKIFLRILYLLQDWEAPFNFQPLTWN